jgi:hypothetical protein
VIGFGAVFVVVSSAGCSMTRVGADVEMRRSLAAVSTLPPPIFWPARHVPGLLEASTREQEAGRDTPGHSADGAKPKEASFTLRGEPVGSAWVVTGWWRLAIEEIGMVDVHAQDFQTLVFHEPPKDTTESLAEEDRVWGKILSASEGLRVMGHRIDQASLAVTWRVRIPEVGTQGGTPGATLQHERDFGGLKGVMVRLRSIGPPEYEEPIDEAFLRRGWAVVSSAGMTMQGRVKLTEERGAAMTASERDAEMVRLAGQAAHDLQVDWAYSTEAALRHVKRARPVLAGLPVVLVGCSFGAIVSPTAAARIDPDAMVLVGGGSDGLRTLVWAAEEVFDGPGLFADGEGRGVTRAMAEAAVGAYLEGHPFDSYNVAPALAGTPTLLLHGASDGIVDSRFGDLLWERLGRPERWVGNYGHSLLFYLLPGSAGEIAAWAEGALEARLKAGGGG